MIYWFYIYISFFCNPLHLITIETLYIYNYIYISSYSNFIEAKYIESIRSRLTLFFL